MKCIVLLIALVCTVVLTSCEKEQITSGPSAKSYPASTTARESAEGDPAVKAKILEINKQLAAKGMRVAIEAIHYYTEGAGRPSDRIHQQDSRWVPNDPNRLALGNKLTYIVDQSAGATRSGLKNAQTEAAIDKSMFTWDNNNALKKVTLVKRPDPNKDITIYDSFFGYGKFGNYLAADIVNAGFFPAEFFRTTTGSNNVLAFSVSFVWTDEAGNPTDINGDNYFDTALNEVYYNDGYNWGINVPLGAPNYGIDVETVALHENGHSLGLGHFGPNPIAVMNPVYAGIRHQPYASDEAGMNIVFGSWPNP